MTGWDAARIAEAAGARLRADRAGSGPDRAVIDSREAGPGALFIGLAGTQVNGSEFAAQALANGAWGVLIDESHAAELRPDSLCGGAVLAAAEPLRALQDLATAWRRRLGAQVIGVTGSTGKTSTKDLLLALLAHQRRTVASRANYNTEIGLPLEILAAPEGTEILVLEMAMRGAGQIAELAAIAEPEVGVIVNVGPVHLELLGTIEAVAAAKAELIAALPPSGVAVVPASEPLLDPHLRSDLRTLRFGRGGEVELRQEQDGEVEIDLVGRRIRLQIPFTQAHLRSNLLAAAAAAWAVGVVPQGRVELTLAPGRGQRVPVADDVILIDDCYNANPMSMRAALQDLADTAEREQRPRRVAVLGDMLELGPREDEFHAALGPLAEAAGVDVLVSVGPRAAAIGESFGGETQAVADAAQAAELVPGLLRPGDIVLVKGSRGVGLELVCGALRSAAAPTAPGASR